MDINDSNFAPERIRDDLGRAITIQSGRLEKLKTAYEAISAVDSIPADMPQAPVVPGKGEKPSVIDGVKVDRRKWNGGNSTKAKDPKKDGRKYNGRKAGAKKATTAKKSTRKRATAKA